MLNIELRNRGRNHLHAEEVYNLVFEIRATQMKELVHKTIIIISIANIYHVFTSERDCSKCFACLLSFYSDNCLIRQVLESSPSHKRTLQQDRLKALPQIAQLDSDNTVIQSQGRQFPSLNATPLPTTAFKHLCARVKVNTCMRAQTIICVITTNTEQSLPVRPKQKQYGHVFKSTFDSNICIRHFLHASKKELKHHLPTMGIR